MAREAFGGEHRPDVATKIDAGRDGLRSERTRLRARKKAHAGDQDSFLFFEEWESQEALDKHFATPYFQDFMARFPEMITGQPVIKIYSIGSIKQL